MFLYIGTGILKVCENAKISHRRLQKVELGYQNVKKLKLYHLRYSDSHKDPARQKKSFYHFNILRCQRSTQNVIKILKTPKLILEVCEW